MRSPTRRARSACEIRIRTRVTGIELGPGHDGQRRAHGRTARSTPSTSSTRRASGRRRSPRWSAPPALGAGRPPARADAGGPRTRRYPRQPVLPGHRQSRLRQGRGRRDADRRLRAESPWPGGPTACPWDHGASPVESDIDRFAPLLEGAIRRFPFLERSGVIRLLCHPDAMTPDGNPLLGPMPGYPGFWVAAGLSLNGFGGAGGHGRALAEWMIDGRAADSTSTRIGAWRFGAVYDDPCVRHGLRPRGLPLLLPAALPVRRRRVGARPHARARCRSACRSSARCSAPRTAGSAPTTSSPGGGGGAAAPTSGGSAGRGRPWFEQRRRRARGVPRAGRDHRHDLVRQARGVRSRRAGRCSSACRDSRIDRRLGSVIYTQFLQPARRDRRRRHRHPAGEQRFRVITGAGTVDADRGWLELNRRAGRRPGRRSVTAATSWR